MVDEVAALMSDVHPAGNVIMLRSLKMHGMAQAVSELSEQGAPAFEAVIPILSYRRADDLTRS